MLLQVLRGIINSINSQGFSLQNEMLVDELTCSIPTTNRSILGIRLASFKSFPFHSDTEAPSNIEKDREPSSSTSSVLLKIEKMSSRIIDNVALYI